MFVLSSNFCFAAFDFLRRLGSINGGELSVALTSAPPPSPSQSPLAFSSTPALQRKHPFSRYGRIRMIVHTMLGGRIACGGGAIGSGV